MTSGEARVFRTLLKAGYECYLVGGSVRDRLLGRSGADLDFTTNARPEQIQRLFSRSFYPNRFGTVLVILGDAQYEITTYRGEGRYSDHRHPDEIGFVDRLEDDLKRRDFTMNAMAMDAEGRLVDPFGGREDLALRLIRAVGNPEERLAEDPLRMLRAARFAAQLGFSIERQTWSAIVQHATLLSMISRERVRDELLKLLASDHPVSGIDFLDHLGLLADVLPALTAVQRINGRARGELDVYQHALQTVRFCPPGAILRLASLLHVVAETRAASEMQTKTPTASGATSSSDDLERTLVRLRLSNQQSEQILRLLDALQSFPAAARAGEREVRRLLAEHGDLFPDLLALVAAHQRGLAGPGASAELAGLRRIVRLAGRIRAEKQPLQISDLAVTGSDLMQELGLPEGRAVGQLLRILLDRVLDDPALNRRDLLLRIGLQQLQSTQTALPQ
jgi:tRNA nucleotidyltransferase (CCA-adding enzyme)